MLSQYATNPAQNWKSKDAACFLVTSLASRGQTERHGVTQTSQLVNLTDFANIHIFNELSQADGIFYLFHTFLCRRLSGFLVIYLL